MLSTHPDTEPVTLFPIWKEAVRRFMETNPKPGARLSPEWLNKNFDLATPRTAKEQKDHQIALMVALKRFRDTLLVEHKICLKALHNGAYEVVDPQQQTDHAATLHTHRIHKELNHMIKKMHHVDHAALTDDQIKKNTDAIVKAATLKSMVRGRRVIGISQQKKISSKQM